jgi:hypothetical protein
MRRKAAVIILGLVGLAFVSCGFQAPQFTGDAPLPPATVGFAQETSLQDEASGNIQVIVRLSRPAPEAITVNYQFVGGSALRDVDYTAQDDGPVQDGTLTFAVGETEHGIPLKIAIDSVEEQDETIELALSAPTGAELGTSHHTITISARLLPRVSFTVDQSQGAETGMVTLNLALDSAPLLASSATIAVKTTTGTASTFDYSMPGNLKVDFPINTTTGMISIPITIDTVDEDDEDFTIELATTENVIIDATKKEHKHTIMDDDDPPIVSISANAMANEGNAGATTPVTVTVSLSGPSGKVVTVPITYGTGTATEGSDYAQPAPPATLVFMPNQNPAMSEISKQITFTVTGDATDEADQTVVTSLVDAPTNATLVGSTRTVNTYTIVDDDAAPTIRFVTPSGMAFEDDPPPATHTSSYQLTLSAASEKAISYDITLTGTADVPSDYTTSPAGMGTGNKTVRMSVPAGMLTSQLDLIIVADNTNEGPDETIIMTISNANLSNVSKDANDQSRTHTIQDSDP